MVHVISQLNAVRDAGIVERILIANSRTNMSEVNAMDYEHTGLLSKLKELRHLNKPFVVRSGAANWTVVQRWGDTASLLQQAKIEEEKFPNRKYTVYKPELDGHLNQSHAAPFGYMSFHKYLLNARRNKLYLLGVPDRSGRGASPFEMKKGELAPPIFAEDIDNDSGVTLFASVFQGSTACRRHVFFNSAYSFTNLHYDTDWNTYVCVLGTRRWTIAHPGHAGIVGAAGGGASYSLLRPTKGIDGLKLNRLAHLVKFLKVDLKAGDVLCVPPTWWHVVEGVTDGFSCGINWFYTFPTIDVRSPSDSGWDWMHPPSQRLLLKASFMSSMNECSLSDMGGNSPTSDADEPLQPSLAGRGLQECGDADFVQRLGVEISDMFGYIPKVVHMLVSQMKFGCQDFMISRQLGRIILNSCHADQASLVQFEALCRTAVELLESRRTIHEASELIKKRKR